MKKTIFNNENLTSTITQLKNILLDENVAKHLYNADKDGIESAIEMLERVKTMLFNG